MILADFECPEHGVFEAYADADAESAPCPFRRCNASDMCTGCLSCASEPASCYEIAEWSPSPIHGSVQAGSVVRGPVSKPDSPMFLDTRELGEGMPLKEFKEKRRKLYEERRHKESKSL
jgi:hypothetical protein